MAYIDDILVQFKNMIEQAIITGGAKGKESMIRSSGLINLIHDAVKYELQQNSVNPSNVFPPFGYRKPEIKMAGFLKPKNQDVCVIPSNIEKKPGRITWGPMAYQENIDPYGFEYSTNTLVINVRSQMSSLAKNSDTLFERTFAEALNLHLRYPDMVLGEVYVIPVNEYDDIEVANNRVKFKEYQTNVEKYISFFDSINNRQKDGPAYMYERCALLVIDFSKDKPKLFRNSDELKSEGIISDNFQIEYATLGFDNFANDILEIYKQRHNIKNILV